MKKTIKGFAAGVIATSLVSTIALGDGIFTKIMVDYDTVKSIVINGVDKTPTGELKPFVFKDRTYVPLRYISEAMGKEVDWDGSTGTVKIEDKVAFSEEKLSIETSSGTVYGTLTIPKTQKPSPLVLIVPGSGPTDRDGNNPMGVFSNTYKLIAEDLADKGFAALRYDKRGIGESKNAIKNEADLRFEDYIDDVVDWTELLKQDSRFSKVVILGHSEGALIGSAAAEKSKADGFISVAGVGYKFQDLLLTQLSESLAQQSPALYEESVKIIAELSAGRQVSNISTELMSLFRPSVQPYLISEFKYDPAEEIRKISIPTLILQGTTDIQVAAENADILHKANAESKLAIIEGMNHILKIAPLDREANLATYSNPSLPLADGLIDEIEGFLKD